VQSPSFVVRDYQESDRNFILSSWLKSYRHNSYFAKRIRNKEYFNFHHAIVNRILDRAKTIVACKIDDPNLIYGFFTHEEALGYKIGHFLYVKESFREFKIGKTLFESSKFQTKDTIFTHWTFMMDGLKEKFPELTYNPYLL
jgi:hypothetical protein